MLCSYKSSIIYFRDAFVRCCPPLLEVEVIPMREVKRGIFGYSYNNLISSSTRPQPEALKNEHLILVIATLNGALCSKHRNIRQS